MPTKRELRDDEEPRPENPKNMVRKVKPKPETEFKALKQRERVAGQEYQPRTMEEARKYNEQMEKDHQKRFGKQPVVRMMKKGYDPKKAMKLLADTIRFMEHKVPIIRPGMKNPTWGFLMEVYDSVAKWPDRVLREFLQELTTRTPSSDVAENIGDVKRVIHEIFDDKGIWSAEPYLARWRLWPYRKSKVDQPDPQPNEDEENIMANKMATKKKVESVKRTTEEPAAAAVPTTPPEKGKKAAKAKPAAKEKAAAKDKPAAKEKPAKTGGDATRRVLGDETKLSPGKSMPTKGIYGQLLPLIPKSGITMAALVKVAATKIKFPASKVRRYAAGAVREGYATAE